MTEIQNKDSQKICPSCRKLTSVSNMKTYISRSSGRKTTSLRCISCIARKMAGNRFPPIGKE